MKIGIVKYYNLENKLGVVCESGEKNYVRYIINQNLEIKKGDIVVFKSSSLEYFEDIWKRKKGLNYIGTYCYDVKKAIDIKEDIISEIKLRHQKSISNNSDFYIEPILCYLFPELINFVIEKNLKPYKELLENSLEYVRNINFPKILANYKIELNKGGRCKPGDDDSAWAFIESSRDYSINKCDLFLNDLLPEIRIETFSDRGFVPYHKMLESYDSENDEKYALKLNDSVKYRAEQLYSSKEHLDKLQKMIRQKILDIRKEYKIKNDREVREKILRCVCGIY